MSPIRQIPMRLAPLQGESLDSWLGTYLHRLQAPLGDVLRQAGYRGPRPDYLPRSLSLGQPAALLVATAEVTGHVNGELEALVQPIRRYIRSIREVPGTLPTVLGASRFCPACLEETDGRWMLAWRVAWVVACPQHHLLLQTQCPYCGGNQAHRRLRVDNTPIEPWRCTSPGPGATGRAAKPCGADLTAALRQSCNPVLEQLASQWWTPTATDDESAALQLTSLVNNLVTANGARPLRGEPTTVTAALTRPEQFAKHLSTVADAVLHPNGDAFRDLATSQTAHRPTALPPRWQRMSNDLVSEAYRLRADHLPPIQRMRWNSLDAGRRPTRAEGEVALRSAELPSALWRSWALRLLPIRLSTDALFPAAAAASLLLPGSLLSIRSLATLILDDATAVAGATRTLAELTRNPQGGAVVAALEALALRLRTETVPIDYARRRDLFNGAKLVSPAQWRSICRTTGSPVGDSRRLSHAQLRVWELLTAGYVGYASHELIARPDGLASYYEFIRRATPTMLDALERHALGVLQDSGIDDEPLGWEPPDSWLPTPRSGWPGVDLNTLDIAKWRVAIGEDKPLGEVAKGLGTSLTHVRLVLSTGQLAQDRPPHKHDVKHLDEAVLRDAVEVRRLPLRDVAEQLGVDRKTVSRYCREFGIPMQTPGQSRRRAVDASWLRRQYLGLGRTLPDIAAELNTTPTTIAKRAKEVGIPLRGRGGASHLLATRTTSDLPALLASCLRGQGGDLRVTRFRQIAVCRSINDAARIMNANAVALVNQVKKLEAAAGGELLERSPKQGNALALTPLGRTLLKQAARHLPPVEAHLAPEPLRTVLSTFRPGQATSRLAAVADHQTLRSAAEDFGLAPADLRRQFLRLERASGMQLATRLEFDRKVLLSRTGAKVVEQWRDFCTSPFAPRF